MNIIRATLIRTKKKFTSSGNMIQSTKIPPSTCSLIISQNKSFLSIKKTRKIDCNLQRKERVR